jgi:hypothetical protein
MNPIENVKLLRLVAEDELLEFTRSLGLDDRSANRALLKKLVGDFEPRRIVDAIFASKGSTIKMLADIFRTVGRYGVSLRTTGFVLVLPGNDGPVRHAFSAQLVSMIATFSDDWSTVGRDRAFASIASLVDEALVPLIKQIEREGRVRHQWRPDRRYPVMMKRSNLVNERLVRQVDAYAPLLRSAYDRVAAAIGPGNAPPPIDAIHTGLAAMERAQAEPVFRSILSASSSAICAA